MVTMFSYLWCIYIYIKSRTKILPRKFISYHSFLPFLPKLDL